MQSSVICAFQNVGSKTPGWYLLRIIALLNSLGARQENVAQKGCQYQGKEFYGYNVDAESNRIRCNLIVSYHSGIDTEMKLPCM